MFYLQVAKTMQPQWSRPASARVDECYAKARRDKDRMLKGVLFVECVVGVCYMHMRG